MQIEQILLVKLLTQSKWIQKHETVRMHCKNSAMFLMKIATGNRGLIKNIGSNDWAFRFDYNFAFQDFQHWGDRHNNLFKTLLHVSERKKVIFDIGAHIGLCSMPVSKVVGKGGKVYAFEPSETNMHYFLKNIQYNNINNIKLIPYLVGEKSRLDVPFYESKYVAGMNSIVPYKNDGSYKCIKKRQVSLDDFCAENNISPDVIKIDVEGAEAGVLKGARNILLTCRPKIILSVHPNHLTLLGESLEDLGILIRSLKYEILDADRRIVHDFNLKAELKEYLLEPF